MKLTPQERAMRLVNLFTFYGYIVDATTSELAIGFAKFAAKQHVIEVTTPDLPIDQVVENMALISAINELEISYPTND